MVAAAHAGSGDGAPFRCFQAARELLQAKDDKARRMAATTGIEGARLEHLMCFVGAARMHEEMQDWMATIDQQAQEVREINKSRSKEVLRLTLEIASLQAQLLAQAGGSTESGTEDCQAASAADCQADLLRRGVPRCPPHRLAPSLAEMRRPPTGSPEPSPEPSPSEESSLGLTSIAAFEETLSRRSVMLRELRQEVAEAEAEASQLGVTLAVTREAHTQELRAIAARVLPRSSRRSSSPRLVGEAGQSLEPRSPSLGGGEERYVEGCAELRRVCGRLRGVGERLLSLQPTAATPPLDLAAWLRIFAECLETVAAEQAGHDLLRRCTSGASS